MLGGLLKIRKSVAITHFFLFRRFEITVRKFSKCPEVLAPTIPPTIGRIRGNTSQQIMDFSISFVSIIVRFPNFYPLCPPQEDDGIQEVSGLLPLISTSEIAAPLQMKWGFFFCIFSISPLYIQIGQLSLRKLPNINIISH